MTSSKAQVHPTVILSEGWGSGRERRIAALSVICTTIRVEMCPSDQLFVCDSIGTDEVRAMASEIDGFARLFEALSRYG